MAESALRVGQHVKLIGKDISGTVAFVGATKFAAGKWVGVVLKDACGRNNGTVEGISYFKCEERFGLFVRQSQLESAGGGSDVSPPHTPVQQTAAATPRSSSSSSSSSSLRKRMEPTSFKRKPHGNPVPQKPDRLRLPIAGGGPGGSSSIPALRRTPSSGSGWRQSDQNLARRASTATTPGSQDASPKDVNRRMTASFVETGFVETRCPSAGFAPPSSAPRQEERAGANQELENLKTEVQDLNEKLETLKIKRAQDKERLKEGEKWRLQVEQQIEFKSRIMESQAQLQRELSSAKTEAREATESRNQTVEDTQDLADTLEMITLDKEMAEERAETLQIELDQAMETIEELNVDLEILKEAGVEGGLTVGPMVGGEGGEEDGGATLLQVKQLEQQNQRLHDTLVKMRDVAAHEKHEMQKLSKEMEARKTELGVATRCREQQEQQLGGNAAVIADLQEQVDAALGAEDMVETLTDRNLELEEQVLELTEQVRDLEDINYTNDLLMEGCKEQELELREDVDLGSARCKEVERERDALGAVVVDRDTTIAKFRDLVQTLTQQNSDLRQDLQTHTNKPVGTPSEVIDFKKLFSETKAHSAAIDLELRQLELQQAQEHVNYIKQYLPDNFMSRGGDQDAVNLLLLLPRLIWKSEVVMGGVAKFPEPSTVDRHTVLKSHAVDQYSFACRLRQLLHTLQSCAHQFQHAVNSGPVDQFLALGGLYPELAGHERALDQYVDRLKRDQLDENIGLELLDKIVSSVLLLHSTHLSTTKLQQPLLLQHLTRAVAAAAEVAHTETARIRTLMPVVCDGAAVSLCCQVEASSTSIIAAVKRIKRRLPQDGSAGPITYPAEVQASLLSMVESTGRAATALRHVARACMQQADLQSDSFEGMSNSKVQELIHEATDLTYGSEDQGPESVCAALATANSQLTGIASSLEKGEYDYDGTPQETTTTPPIVQRAQNIKGELKDSEHIKYKLESRDQDLRDLRVLTKQKNEELSEMMVRRDLAEKKLFTATKDADATIEKLQRKVDDTMMINKRKEKEYEETMDHLQSDIECLESEKGELKEKLTAFKKRSLYDPVEEKSATSPGIGNTSLLLGSSPVSISSGGQVVHDSPQLVQQIQDLKTALRSATATTALATSCKMRQRLAALQPIQVCRVATGEEKRDLSKDEGSGECSNRRAHDSINSLAQQTSKLKKELQTLISNSSVVDISHRKAGLSPFTASMKPLHHLQHSRSTLLAYQMTVDCVQSDVLRAVACHRPGGSVAAAMTPFPSTQLTKVVAEGGKLAHIGQLTVPGTGPVQDAAPLVTVPVVMQPQHIHRLHAQLLQ